MASSLDSVITADPCSVESVCLWEKIMGAADLYFRPLKRSSLDFTKPRFNAVEEGENASLPHHDTKEIATNITTSDGSRFVDVLLIFIVFKREFVRLFPFS